MGEMAYVVTYGEYSDYGISGVYSTLENAEAACGRDGRVEFYPLDDADDAYGPWTVRVFRDGSKAKANRYPQRVRHPGTIFRGRAEASLGVWARTEEQALKAANERRAFLIASGVWVEGTRPIQLTDEMFEGARAS